MCVCVCAPCVHKHPATHLLNFFIIFFVMARSPNVGYFFLNNVNTLPWLLGHSFSMYRNIIFARLHIMPQYCAMAIDCWCKRTRCFSDISNAAPATTHTCIVLMRREEGGRGRTSNRPWSDSVHARIVGSSLLSKILLTSFFHIHLLFSLRHLYRDRLRKGGRDIGG